MKIKFDVTQEHIDNGKQGCGESCAIALALTEVLGVPVRDVGATYIAIPAENKLEIERGDYETPDAVVEFIDRFDADKSRVQPKTFEFDLVRF